MTRIDVKLIHPSPTNPHGFGAFGRHVEHDARSLRYTVATADNEVFEDVRWQSSAPILDQGDLGGCTGYACAALLSYLYPDYPHLPASTDAEGWDTLAKSLYSQATNLDSIPGHWPTDDTGSTGLAVAKAAKADGFASGYLHITDAAQLAKALQQGPLIVGTNWYNSMFYPDSSGDIVVSEWSGLAGGHEYVLDEVAGSHLGFRNSWGESFGVEGRFYMNIDDFLWLLHQEGDATQLVPVDQPAPEPTPEPTPTNTVNSDVLAAYTALKKWAQENEVA